MKAYPKTDALINSGPGLRSPVNIARNIPLACLLPSRYPRSAHIPFTNGAKIAALALILGINGAVNVPTTSSPVTCPVKLAGKSFRTLSVTRFIRPLSETPTLMPNADRSSHHDAPENAEKTVSVGTPQKTVNAAHMSSPVTNSGNTFTIHHTMAHVRMPRAV